MQSLDHQPVAVLEDVERDALGGDECQWQLEDRQLAWDGLCHAPMIGPCASDPFA